MKCRQRSNRERAQRLCEQGSEYFESMYGKPYDPALAAVLFRAAAAHGSGEAMFALANLYGSGLARDTETAGARDTYTTWLERAAQRGRRKSARIIARLAADARAAVEDANVDAD